MIKVVEIKKTCEMCPSQWEGTDVEARPVYVRYRWGFLWVGVGQRGGDIDSAVSGKEVFGKQVGKSPDGVMSYDELRTATAGVMDLPQEETS